MGPWGSPFIPKLANIFTVRLAMKKIEQWSCCSYSGCCSGCKWQEWQTGYRDWKALRCSSESMNAHITPMSPSQAGAFYLGCCRGPVSCGGPLAVQVLTMSYCWKVPTKICCGALKTSPLPLFIFLCYCESAPKDVFMKGDAISQERYIQACAGR